MRNLNLLISNLLLYNIVACSGPIILRSSVADGVKCDLITLIVKLIDESIVGVFMADVESGARWTSIGILATVKNISVGFCVSDIDAIVEGDRDELKKKL